MPNFFFCFCIVLESKLLLTTLRELSAVRSQSVGSEVKLVTLSLISEQNNQIMGNQILNEYLLGSQGNVFTFLPKYTYLEEPMPVCLVSRTLLERKVNSSIVSPPKASLSHIWQSFMKR